MKGASRRKASGVRGGKSVRLRWLGQAGFEIAAPDGATCLIDPYLSNWCGPNTGSYRVVPSALEAAAVRPAFVLTTHWHEDHLDPESIPIIARSAPDAIFVGPPSNSVRCRRWGIAAERLVSLARGETYQAGPFRITAGFARHEVPGFLSEDAISLLIEVGGRRIYHSGDTEYDSRIRATIDLRDLDVGLFVINGTGGNMNAPEAALLAASLACGTSIPMHYGMWSRETYGAGATLDPHEFAQLVRRYGGRAATVLAHGQTIDVE